MNDMRVELVDSDGRTIGEMEKIAAHQPPGSLHRAFSAFVMNEEGSLLIQRRSLAKYHWPGIWSNSCCSHPLPGEFLDSAVDRRIQQELGLTVIGIKEVGRTTYRHADPISGLVEWEYNHVVHADAGSAVDLNPEEVASCQWVPVKDIHKFLDGRSKSSWFDDVFSVYKEGMGL